jgi:chromosomal replication initiator protein
MTRILVEEAHQTVWRMFLHTVRTLVDEDVYSTWFTPIDPLHLSGENVLTVQIPNRFFFEWLQEHYSQEIGQTISKVLGPTGKLAYRDGSTQASRQPELAGRVINEGQPMPQAPVQSTGEFILSPVGKTLAEQYLQDSDTVADFSFENYVEGDCNALARAASLALSDRPGKTAFNPLLIYGGVGLGKTHLLHAIGNRVKANFPGKTVIYISASRFTDQFVDALRTKRMSEFTAFYMRCDVLLMDDVQVLAGKEATQDFFFNVFNHMQLNQRQVVMTSDCAPKDLRGMQERLLSRLKKGLSADIQAPNFETRLAILQRKLETENEIHLPKDVIEYLAKSVKSNIRELEGALVSMIAQARFGREPFDLTRAKLILQNILDDIEQEVDMGLIHKSVSEYYVLAPEVLTGRQRTQEIARARQVAMYFAKIYTDFSLKSIGNYFNRDHSTVIHAIQAVENLIECDKRFKADIESLKKKFDRE